MYDSRAIKFQLLAFVDGYSQASVVKSLFRAIFLSLVLVGCGDSTPIVGGDGTGGGGPDSPGDASAGGGQLGPPAPLRIVSWNALNFYDDVEKNCLGWCPSEEVPTTQEYSNKLAGIARGLKLLAGDVVLLQEVENMAVLDALAARSEVASLNYSVRKIEPGNDPRGITLGLLSRVPIDAYISHAKDQFTRRDNPSTVYTFARDVVEIHLTHQGKKVRILNVHFKARVDDGDPDRRVAEAQHARKIADTIMTNEPDAYVFVGGDFNDTPDADSYKAMRDGYGSGAVPFVAALDNVPQPDRYSYSFKGTNQLLDHLFAAPQASERIDSATVTIVHDSTLPSDHSPIAATYMVP